MSQQILTISAGTGPVEVRRFVALLLPALRAAWQRHGIETGVTWSHGDRDAPRSAGLVLPGSGRWKLVARSWLGTHCLIATSPARGRRARKRWYAGVSMHGVPSASRDLVPGDVAFTVCRAGGPGGQHVQKSNTAVHARHTPSGLVVRSEGHRSQQANRKAALERLAEMLAARADAVQQTQRRQMWRAHHEVLRGNPVRRWRIGGDGRLEEMR